MNTSSEVLPERIVSFTLAISSLTGAARATRGSSTPRALIHYLRYTYFYGKASGKINKYIEVGDEKGVQHCNSHFAKELGGGRFLSAEARKAFVSFLFFFNDAPMFFSNLPIFNAPTCPSELTL